MIVDFDTPLRVGRLAVAEWSAAEFLDAGFSDDTQLRALICRLAASQWQWMILSIEGENGELISLGTAKSVAEARSMAASKIAKCLEGP